MPKIAPFYVLSDTVECLKQLTQFLLYLKATFWFKLLLKFG